MGISRRGVLGAGAALPLVLAGCGTDEPKAADSTSATAELWYWPGGLSEKVLAAATTHFAGRTRLHTRSVTGDYQQQLLAVLTGGKQVPGIVGIKGEDVASLLPRADRFVDLNTLGARRVESEYLGWKWQQGSTTDDRLIGFPIDIGPTAMFYRRDLFARAGLPTEPAAVTTRLATWDDYLTAGRVLVARLPGVRLLRNCKELFTNVVGQGTTRFVDASNHFVGDQPHIRSAWDTAVRAVTLGLTANIQAADDAGWKSAIAGGRLATELGAAWHALDVEQAAPADKGAWRVAAGPAAGANYGGSFLAIPADGPDHGTAFAIIEWLLSPANQTRGFTDAALFPSTPASYATPALTAPDPFFGGQRTIDVFGASARAARRAYEAPSDTAIAQLYVGELENVEGAAKPPDRAWSDAVAAARSLATGQGVN